jgi:hypothetical protein
MPLPMWLLTTIPFWPALSFHNESPGGQESEGMAQSNGGWGGVDERAR